MAKVLVTGASGFTGSNLCRRLIKEKESVVAFVRKTSRTDELQAAGIECRTVDIRNSKEVLDNFRGFSKVYHVAAAFRGEHIDREEFERVNVAATKNLLEASLQNGVQRFIHCSTVGVQGEINDPPAKEDYRYNPGDHYQETKLRGEMLAKEYMTKGLPVSIVRPVGIYGPGDKRFLKLFRPISKQRFIMIGSGKSLYHLTFIDDLVEGFWLCANHPNAVGETFTIGGGRYTTLNELVHLIADVLGKPRPRVKIPYASVYIASLICEKVCRALNLEPPIYPRRVEFFSKDRAFDIAKARQRLGYEPKVDLEEGVRLTANWYREEGLI